MRRDTIFYQLFRQSPTLLFELISQPPIDADRYSNPKSFPVQDSTSEPWGNQIFDR